MGDQLVLEVEQAHLAHQGHVGHHEVLAVDPHADALAAEAHDGVHRAVHARCIEVHHQVPRVGEARVPGPGHEIVGKVTQVGKKVGKFSVGDTVGVGCLVHSCRACTQCREGFEQLCEKGATFTYNSEDPEQPKGTPTYGGYSSMIVVDQDFVLKIPHGLDLKGVAPLLCAGITTYSPLRHWNVGPGKKVGIVGLGGLGHMGVKFARSFGAEVTVFTRSESKSADALRLGAHHAVVSTQADAMAQQAGKFDFILNTVAAQHDLGAYLGLLKRDGTMTLVGVPEDAHELHPIGLIFGRKSLAGSLIGGIAETQEMLDYCGKHKIVSDVEMIPIQKVNQAYERTVKGDVKYRFVIDLNSMKQ
jgi:uncharacterized zinc-type alcohol dehydrogenase-like protein